MRYMFYVVSIALCLSLSYCCSIPKEDVNVSKDAAVGSVTPLPMISYDDLRKAGGDISDWGYGPKVSMTFALMGDMPLKDVFSPVQKAKDVFLTWADNCTTDNPLMPKISGELLAKVKANIESVAAKCPDDLMFRTLYTAKVNLSPMALDLTAISANVDLPFLAFQNQLNPEVAGVLDKLVEDPQFGAMTLYQMYTTPADPAIYPSVELVAQLFDGAGLKILRNTPVDLTVVANGRQYVVMNDQAKANDKCCVKTIRTCTGLLSSANCTMCGVYCCLASTWC